MLTSARNILPVLMLVCLFSFLIRGAEVWSGVKSISGSAFAVEPAKKEEVPPQQQDTATNTNAPTESVPEPPQEMKTTETEGAEHSQETKPLELISDETKQDDPSAIDEYEDYEITPVQAELAKDLVEQRKRLEQRENELMQKEALLKAAEQQLDRKYQELVILRTDIEKLLNTQSEEENKRIASLVKIYENMKPKEAADIFNTLDIDILVEVISKMSERKISPILAAMNPERARTVTIMLAEQKSLPELPAN